MMSNMKPSKLSVLWLSSFGGLIALASFLGAGIGTYMAQQSQAPAIDLEPLRLQADSAARGKSISLATGWIDESVEGIYILDHLTGNLQCWVLSPRTGKISGIYTANVNVGLEADRAGEKDYVMSTGLFNFTGGAAGQKIPARSVVYVAEGNSGNVAAFGLQYDKNVIRRGNGVDNGTLELIGKAPARGDEVTREQ
jgi:hypothetical protein